MQSDSVNMHLTMRHKNNTMVCIRTRICNVPCAVRILATHENAYSIVHKSAMKHTYDTMLCAASTMYMAKYNQRWRTQPNLCGMTVISFVFAQQYVTKLSSCAGTPRGK